MIGKATLQSYKQLRVYRRISHSLLVIDMACNRLMKLTYLVNKAPLIYRAATKIFGHGLVNSIIHNTYCKIFTAGENIVEVNEYSDYFRMRGVPVILDYCAQGDIAQPDLEKKLQQNAWLFAESAGLAAQYKNQLMSIKMTGLLDVRVLKKWNDAVELRDNFWRTYSRDGVLSYSQLVKGLRRIKSDVTEGEIQQYIRVIHNKSGQAQGLRLDELDFKINHQPYFLYDSVKNENVLIRAFFPLSQSDRKKVLNFVRRLDMIIDPGAENENNFRILVDAEQTYVQKAIEVVSEQLQEKYNTRRAYIIPTIQNYLKRSVERGMYQIKLNKRKNLFFGTKLVRGAYIVEETKLAKEMKYENPIVDDFDATTSNYLANFRHIVENIKGGEVMVATHNLDTIQEVIKIKEEYHEPLQVSFAQLLGLADHLTWMLKEQGHRVYKYLPWAETEVMVPYMIRRAQQLNQMKYPLDIQFQLLKHELAFRLRLV